MDATIPVADTNLVVRLIVRDDPAQVAVAEAALAGGIEVLLTVLLECEWVLRASYGLDRKQVADGLRTLIGLPGCSIERPEVVSFALTACLGGADFADPLHVGQCIGRASFLTFDRKLARRIGTTAPVAIELLGPD